MHVARIYEDEYEIEVYEVYDGIMAPERPIIYTAVCYSNGSYISAGTSTIKDWAVEAAQAGWRQAKDDGHV